MTFKLHGSETNTHRYMHEPHEQDRKHGTFLIFFFLEVSGMWLLSFLFLGWVFLPLSTTSPDNTEAFVRAIRHSEIQAAIYRFVKIDEKRWTKNANNNDTEAFVKAIRHFEIQTTIYKFDKIDEKQWTKLQIMRQLKTRRYM